MSSEDLFPRFGRPNRNGLDGKVENITLKFVRRSGGLGGQAKGGMGWWAGVGGKVDKTIVLYSVI